MIIDYLANHMGLLDELTDLSCAQWKDLYQLAGITKDTVRETFAQRAVKGRIPITLVALEAGALLGMGEIKLSESTAPDLSPWLSTIYVKKNARRRGVGSKIVRALEQESASLGVTRLYLSTEDGIAFYENLGWTVRNDARFYGKRVTVMHKAIAPAAADTLPSARADGANREGAQ